MSEKLEVEGAGQVLDGQALTAVVYRGAAQLAKILHARSGSVDDLVGAICEQAVRIVGPAVSAGVIIASSRQRLTTVAATGPAPAELDRLQTESGEGPCLTAAADQVVVRVPDTGREERWPGYAARARGLGVGSVVCLPLAVDARLLGTLSLYAESPGAFDADGQEHVWQLLTALASVTLAQTRLVEQLHEALANRDLIGQAKGMVMARYGLGSDEAFGLLRRYSQDHNVKLAELAELVTVRGDFPT